MILLFKYRVDEELELKLIKSQDSKELFNLIDTNREHLRQWLPWVDSTIKEEDTKGFITDSMKQYAEDRGFNATIWFRGKLAGLVGLHNYSAYNKKTSIGYWMGKDFQGHGIMTKACSSIIQYLFNELDFQRVEIRCATENYRSQAVPKRLGFKEEGICRKAENLYGTFVDHKVFALLKED